ncbi:DUF368 domain-containing protein [Halalkalibacterium halodurans]|uniref:BH2069 protein n=2 Tax=Halalkalibacterium halodurans TaxID=86665 RepID=Q9KB62_HALH5|nr:DUF368 domain-containing protein [Halalkalibacterium halodurans]MED4080794.1 DUF368 domain-containing protein [Halalkalibacterium halodurans]MED4086038.1 DUF368 domain-containing protein [Halalkalibacterium halodurans]MED4106805.1 DUF368 domain-containing protein [Halalkalibacterium halodurans]MED4109562.1 DUF368 domain-containing protein [Halalkalibacterium halodurans]MED4126341.1 DUF368 domain-containing protein [Halalkalibacterium halodurans]
MFQWKNLFKGMAMGISDLVPGVSGGTIALILGIYQSLITAINGLTTKQWKKHVMFLIPLVIGIGLALLTVSHIISWLLNEYPQPTLFFFIGLIIGIVPTLLKDINFIQSFTPIHYGVLLLGAIIVGATTLLKDSSPTTIMDQLAIGDYILLFFAGWLASTAMILPGVSGSFIFLLLGVYPTVIQALSTFNLAVLFTVGIGIILGLGITSRLISYLFVQYKTATYALMIGFIAGSVFVIYPGMAGDFFLISLSVIAFALGGGTAYMLHIYKNKQAGANG